MYQPPSSEPSQKHSSDPPEPYDSWGEFNMAGKLIYQLYYIAWDGSRKDVASGSFSCREDAMEWERETRACYPFMTGGKWWFGSELDEGFVSIRIQLTFIIGAVCYVVGNVIMCAAGLYGTSRQIDWGFVLAIFGFVLVSVAAIVQTWRDVGSPWSALREILKG